MILRRFIYSLVCLGIVFACGYIALRTAHHHDSVSIAILCISMTVVVMAMWAYTLRYEANLQEQLLLTHRDAQRATLQWTDRVGQAELFTRVSELTEIFTETRDLETVLRRATEIIQEILQVDSATLQVYSDEHNQFFMKAQAGEKDAEICEYVVEEVVGKGMSKLINELSAFPGYAAMSDQGFTSMLMAPIKRRNIPVGLLGALSSSGRHFTDRELRILTTFSSQASLIIENAQLLSKTREMAIRDGLTSLFNHRHFQQTLQSMLADAKKANSSMALIMGDIDDFKKYNDAHGHAMGDIALRSVGKRLISNTRGADMVARYGGEEFVMILPSTDLIGASKVGNTVRENIADHHFEGEESQPGGSLTISLGIAVFPDDAEDPAELIDRADMAMYAAKKKGKNSALTWQDIADDPEHNQLTGSRK